MLLDYLQPISTGIAAISALVAFVVTTYFKEHGVAKAISIIFAVMTTIGAISASFYGQHRWTFKRAKGNSYIENQKYPEAAVAYTENYIRKVVGEIGFGEITVLPRTGQSSLIARKK